MTAIVCGLAAAGFLLVFLGFTSPPRPSRFRGSMERLVHDAGSALPAGGLLWIAAASGLIAGFTAAALLGRAVVALLAAGAGGWLPFSWLRSRRRRKRRAHREVWPDVIELLISAVRSGSSLPEAVASLADRGPDVVRSAFERFRSAHRSSVSFESALARLADDLGDPVADRITAALELAHDVGGTDLIRVLRTLADFTRSDLQVRKEIEARWSWTVTAARLAAGAPWAVLVVMATRPEAAAAYDSAAGSTLVVAGGAATIAGYRLMLRAARLPEEKRLLR